SNLRSDTVRYRFIRRLVGIEVSDAISATSARLEEAGVENLQDLRSLTENVAMYSGELAAENRELKRFLFEHFYRHFRVVRMAVKAERMLSNLFRAYIDEPRQLPKETQRRAIDGAEGLHRTVCD
ncbi:MAG: deoxyguanosinetriphosphate triphosphohydrolase, partial [Caldilineaceae bacterium]|nr:deoxyguanosinetriphosphate triphosphohydrolase [Caldilineaceae bacterium]